MQNSKVHLVQNNYANMTKEDEQFMQDLKSIQTANKLSPCVKPKTRKASSGNKKTQLSQDGNKPHSFKSVTSYVLGDLDISRDDEQASSE